MNKRLTLTLLGLVLAGAFVAGQVKEQVDYVADVDDWRVEVFAGSASTLGVLQGPLLEAGFVAPIQMCFLDGQPFLTSDGVLLTITKDKTVRLVAGSPGLPGYQDGPASQALLGRQLSLCPDGKGGLFLGDRSNRCLRRLVKKDGAWQVETVAGDPAKPASPEQLDRVRNEGELPPIKNRDIIDGQGKAARFSYLHANVIADPQGNAYLMDSDYLRRITPDGTVTTLNPKGGSGNPAGDEPLESAHFRLIMGGGMCFGPDGCIYVADRWNHCVRQVDLAKKTVSIAVGPGGGYIDGPERQCGFHDSPGHIVHDPYRKRFYVNGVDDWGLRVWQNGRMQTIAGGQRKNKALEGPARDAGMHWCGILAIDPRPPHDIYFWSGSPEWRGRIGRLYQVKGGGR